MELLKKCRILLLKRKRSKIRLFHSLKKKLNNIETLLSQALSDFDVNHDECSKILDERNDYELVKENVTLALKNSDVKIQYVNDSTV